MSESTKTIVVKLTPSAKPSVKDSGKVHIGGGMMRFDVKDSGKVHIGGGMMRF
jgi:hypothetical protein